MSGRLPTVTVGRMKLLLALLATALPALPAAPAAEPTPDAVFAGLKDFFAKTAKDDGSFRPGIDPLYEGMSDSAFSDLAPVAYAVVIHKTFGWKLPHEEKTKEFLLSRQEKDGAFVNMKGTVDPKSAVGRAYNTTMGLMALHALGAKPKFDPLPVFDLVLKADYKDLPPYMTSFFPLAYLASGKPIPAEADKKIKALMVQDDDGYLHEHVAATFHAAHYYRLIGEEVPRAEPMLKRTLRDQKADGAGCSTRRRATATRPSTPRSSSGNSVATSRRREGAGQATKWCLSAATTTVGSATSRQHVRRRRELLPHRHAGDGGLPQTVDRSRPTRDCSAGATSSR